MSYHQIDADISLPSRPDLLKKALPVEKLTAIHQLIGVQELSRIAAVTHEEDTSKWKASDWNAVSEREGRDLDVLRKAITQVTGKERPWIIGFASEFAAGLLTVCQVPAN